MEIIRNCSHYSSTQVALDSDSDGNPLRIIKTAFDEEGAVSITKERDGLIWYEERLKPKESVIASFIRRGNFFARLELIYKNGQCGDFKRSVSENYVKIRNALKYHADIFEKSGSDFNHGDFSFENVIFDGDDVIWVIDWENFTNLLPKGFDLIYCVMEVCFFCLKRKGGLTKKDVMAARELLDYSQSQSGARLIDLKMPSVSLRKLILDNKLAFGRQVHKYPFFNSSLEDVVLLDRIFQKWW